MLKIGDLVNVTDIGESYDEYKNWIMDCAPAYLDSWREQQYPTHNRIYKIVAIGQHEFWEGQVMLYLIQECSGNSVYIMGEKGIRLYNKGDK